MKGVLELRGNMFHVNLQPQHRIFYNGCHWARWSPGKRMIPILEHLRACNSGTDGSWIIMEPEGTRGYAEQAATLADPVDRRCRTWCRCFRPSLQQEALRPFGAACRGARNFGRTRKAVPIDPADLNEFEVIARAMNEMQESIKRFIDERTHMLAALSHDLRTNLTGLLLDAEVMTGGGSKDRLIAGPGGDGTGDLRNVGLCRRRSKGRARSNDRSRGFAYQPL